jgi:hypothetical protein
MEVQVRSHDSSKSGEQVATTAQALDERHGWRRDTAFLHYEYH